MTKANDWIILFLLWAIVVGLNLNETNESKQAAQMKSLIPPPPNIEHFHFGYSESLADSFWIRWIQDLDSCGKDLVDRKDLESAHSSTFSQGLAKKPIGKESSSNIEDIISKPSEKLACDQGWGFHLLDAVTKLAPFFHLPYSLGAPALSVINEDHIGAKVIFDRGVEHFPSDWTILYRAAYHYLFELRDLAKAAELLTKAADAGAPDWLKSLAARLYSRAGQAALGIITLKEYQKTVLSEEAKQKIQQRIDALQAELNNPKPLDSK